MSVTITKPNVGGDDGLWGQELNDALDALVAAHNALDVATVKLAQYASGGTAAGGIATVGADGNVEQPSAPHTHPITVQDSGSTTYYTGGRLDVYAGAGNISYDAVNDRIKLLLTPADVRTLRLNADITNSSTTLSSSVTDLLLDLPNSTDVFDIDGLLFFQSSAAALIKVQAQVSGTGAGFLALMTGPTEGTNAASSDAQDATTLRSTIVTIPTNGPQHYGGFPAAGVGKSWCRIQGRVTAGSTAGNFNIKFGQANPTADVTKLLAGSTIFVNRVA